MNKKIVLLGITSLTYLAGENNVIDGLWEVSQEKNKTKTKKIKKKNKFDFQQPDIAIQFTNNSNK